MGQTHRRDVADDFVVKRFVGYGRGEPTRE
jgi:hypothetical protein